jgi:hypothetical protein
MSCFSAAINLEKNLLVKKIYVMNRPTNRPTSERSHVYNRKTTSPTDPVGVACLYGTTSTNYPPPTKTASTLHKIHLRYGAARR